DDEIVATYRQLLHLLATGRPLGPIRSNLSLSGFASEIDLPEQDLRAVEDEPVLVADHQPDAPLALTHDKQQHTTTTEFVLCNTACELLLAGQPAAKTGYGFVA